MSVEKNSIKSFKAINNYISKDDIIPISTRSAPVEQTIETDNYGGSESSSSEETADMLFSPLLPAEDEEVEDEYENGLLSPVYFSSQYPNRFHHSNSFVNINSNSNSAVSSDKSYFGSSDASIGTDIRNGSIGPTTNIIQTNDDFWKEVKITKQESIPFTIDDDFLKNSSVVNTDASDVSVDELVTDDLNILAEKSNSTQLVQDQDDFSKKLIYYRKNNKLNLRLQDHNSKKFGSGATGLVSKRRGRKHFLRNAIRRKSGVWKMVSTGTGIGEFML